MLLFQEIGGEFKDKITLHGFWKVKCQWEVGEVARWEWWRDNEGARRERRESDEVGMWEVHGFILGWGTQGEVKILSFCF